MKNVRLGIVGLGNIGKFHTGYLLENKISRCTLTAVSDAFAPGLKPFEGRPGLKTFANCSEMIRSGEIDAIVIATPHFLHTTIGIEALQAGLHIMVEKPISAHKADAERLIATAREHPKQVFGGMFQMRVEPRYQKIRKLIQDGELGEIVRINWIIRSILIRCCSIFLPSELENPLSVRRQQASGSGIKQAPKRSATICCENPSTYGPNSAIKLPASKSA